MKKIGFLLTLFFVVSCSTNKTAEIHNSRLSEGFLAIKTFILSKGQKRTYSNRFNNNPYYLFGDMEVFLNPEPGGPHQHPQWNINCDPKLSDFTELVIRTKEFQYYHFKWNKSKSKIEFSPDANHPQNTEARGIVLFMKILYHVQRSRD